MSASLLRCFSGPAAFVVAGPAIHRRCAVFSRVPSRAAASSSASSSSLPPSSEKIAGLLTGRSHRGGGGGGNGSAPVGPRWWQTPGAAVGAVALTDVAVYGAWKAAFRYPWLMDFMENNFTASYKNLSAGRLWTLATSTLSHAALGPILSNVNAIYSCGLPLAQIMGVRNFLALYIGSGVASSLSLVAVDAVRARRKGKVPDNEPNLGGSGAVTGLLTAFACAYPHSIVMINGYVRLPVIFEVFATWVYDLVNIGRESQTGVSHAGHFAGAICGLLCYFLRLRKRV